MKILKFASKQFERKYTNYKNYLKNVLILFKRLSCNKNYQKRFDEKSKTRFISTYKFSNHDINRFIV